MSLTHYQTLAVKLGLVNVLPEELMVDKACIII